MFVTKKLTEKSITDLQDDALLALLLTSDGARYYSRESVARMIKRAQDSLNCLISAPVMDLSVNYGLSHSDALRLKVAKEFIRRCQVAEVLDKPKISGSRDAFLVMQNLGELCYEEFWIVVLNRANRVIDRIKISEGGISGTVVDIRKVYKHTIDLLGSALILCHNHPSGNIVPSEQDITVTRRIVEAGMLFDITVLDHIIVGESGFYSFADNGLC